MAIFRPHINYAKFGGLVTHHCFIFQGLCLPQINPPKTVAKGFKTHLTNLHIIPQVSAPCSEVAVGASIAFQGSSPVWLKK